MKIENKKLTYITPYENNPRRNDAAVEYVANSIREFGFKQPIVIDKDGVIVAGHTRYKAAQKLGLDEVPCVMADDLTPEQVKAYRLADNKTIEQSEWDSLKLDEELEGIGNLDMSLFGFFPVEEIDFKNLDDMAESNEEYEEFVEKFKPKKTTDDCYTPPAVYEAVKSWAVKEYNLNGRKIVRPFYPGGDYEKYKYPKNCVVIDNPPFSILAQIKRFYAERKIDFFLFGPAKTLFGNDECCYILTNQEITYENGAKIYSAFVTNLDEARIRTAPDLARMIQEAQENDAVNLPKYDYPNNVVTSARLGKVANYVELKIYPEQCHFIRQLDSQKESGVALFGAGFLLSEKAAAEKAAAEKAAAEKAAAKEATVWELSEREKKIIEEMSKNESDDLRKKNNKGDEGRRHIQAGVQSGDQNAGEDL